MIRVSQRGNFTRTEKFLKTMRNQEMFEHLENLAREGVDALANATPVDSALTAASWGYIVTINEDEAKIEWTNANENGGLLIVILLQYGHATGSGGYVQGQDFINPALAPIFEKIAENVWRAVTTA